MKGKFYKGLRDATGPHVYVFTDDAKGLLNPRTDLLNCADSLDWGDAGNGATQLAFAILMDYFSYRAKALDYLHEFKHAEVVKFPDYCWILTGADIDRTIEKIDAERARIEGRHE